MTVPWRELMTPQQEAHILSILQQFERAADAKYRAGQAEHTGNLWDLSLLQIVDNAIDEAIDQFIYLSTIRGKVVQMQTDMAKAMQDRLGE